jgi:NADH-quinone oxidoreductase subunit A
MLAAYIPVLIFAVLVIAFPVLAFILVRKVRPELRAVDTELQPSKNPTVASSTTGEAFSEGFFIVAMQIVIFGACVLFLSLWAILFRGWLAVHMAAFALVPMAVFVGIVLVGYAWTCKKGALDWD